MRRTLWAGVAGLVVAATVTQAYALVAIALPPSMPQKLAQVDAAVFGKVTAIEAKTVRAERNVGDKQVVEYLVAVVKVNESYFGAQGLTHIKVAFQPPPMPVPVPPPGEDAPIRFKRPFPRPGFDLAKLDKDQEALLFLRKHHKEGFYVVDQGYNVVDKKAPNFAQETAEVKKLGTVIAEPMKALESKDKAERFQAASLLIFRYRTQLPGKTQQEEVSAAETKLIFEALADGDWVQRGGPRGRVEMNAQQMFFMLNLTPADGWMQPQNFQDIAPAAQKWLKDNAGKFKMKKWVAAVEK